MLMEAQLLPSHHEAEQPQGLEGQTEPGLSEELLPHSAVAGKALGWVVLPLSLICFASAGPFGKILRLQSGLMVASWRMDTLCLLVSVLALLQAWMEHRQGRLLRSLRMCYDNRYQTVIAALCFTYW